MNGVGCHFGCWLLATAGLAGFYLVKNSTDVGVGPERWGMDSMEEYHLILQDKVLDPKCQMFYDPEGVHKDNHYGDINLVSGIPFPRLAAQPKRVRFRVLSAAVTRPWLLSLVTEANVEVSSKICKASALFLSGLGNSVATGMSSDLKVQGTLLSLRRSLLATVATTAARSTFLPAACSWL